MNVLVSFTIESTPLGPLLRIADSAGVQMAIPISPASVDQVGSMLIRAAAELHEQANIKRPEQANG